MRPHSSGLWNYVFPTLTLKPGQFWVIGLKMLGFNQVFKRNADDFHVFHFDTKLKDKELALLDQYEHVVHVVSIGDNRPWPQFADGTGTLLAFSTFLIRNLFIW
jgi:hypothetical protein